MRLREGLCERPHFGPAWPQAAGETRLGRLTPTAGAGCSGVSRTREIPEQDYPRSGLPNARIRSDLRTLMPVNRESGNWGVHHNSESRGSNHAKVEQGLPANHGNAQHSHGNAAAPSHGRWTRVSVSRHSRGRCEPGAVHHEGAHSNACVACWMRMSAVAWKIGPKKSPGKSPGLCAADRVLLSITCRPRRMWSPSWSGCRWSPWRSAGRCRSNSCRRRT